jgi:DNA mismatch endonuclease Vsr
MSDPRTPRKTSPRPAFDDVPEARRRNMAAIKGKNTKPELAIRKALHALGYRFRLHDQRLPGRPDLVFRSRRAAVEVRGCFFHRHGCANSVLPRTRRDWWERKLSGNVARDADNEAALAAAGWRLLVVWECDVRRNLPDVLELIRAFLGPPGAPGRT